jgi:SH3-like domain-containing protein
MGLLPQSLLAQSVSVGRDGEPFFNEPAGTRLARVSAGTSFTPGPTQRGHTQVTLEGWVFQGSLRSVNRDGHTLSVSRQPEENLRAEPNGRILARLVYGALLDEVERRGQWVRVRRTGWIPSSALVRPAPAARQPAALPTPTAAASPRGTRSDTASAPPPEASGPFDPRRGVLRRDTPLRRAPDAAPAGTLQAGLPVRIVGRAGQWVRIETQGWVRESEVRLSDDGVLTDVTAAELRASPEDYRGRLLRWNIQFLALQTADELRPDFTPGQKYVLARGPGPEYAFIYVVVPPDKLELISRLEPLASITILARVISGASAFLANPILELVELVP